MSKEPCFENRHVFVTVAQQVSHVKFHDILHVDYMCIWNSNVFSWQKCHVDKRLRKSGCQRSANTEFPKLCTLSERLEQNKGPIPSSYLTIHSSGNPNKHIFMTVHNATASTFENGQDKRQRKGVMGEPISELRLEDRRYTLFQLRDFEKTRPVDKHKSCSFPWNGQASLCLPTFISQPLLIKVLIHFRIVALRYAEVRMWYMVAVVGDFHLCSAGAVQREKRMIELWI